MAKTKQVKKASKNATKSGFEGVYLFKMLLYLLLGSVWLKISNGSHTEIPIPVGLLIGILFSTHEHFQIDRKMEYAILLVAMLFGYFAPYGLFVNL